MLFDKSANDSRSVSFPCPACGKHKMLAEFIELDDHPYFVGTQSHPELKSSLDEPAPLFLGSVQAAQTIRLICCDIAVSLSQ